MKVLLMGGNGFVGRALLNQKPPHITTDPTFCHTPPSGGTETWIHLDLLKVSDWSKTLDGYDAVLICARPKGTTSKQRNSEQQTGVEGDEAHKSLDEALQSLTSGRSQT